MVVVVVMVGLPIGCLPQRAHHTTTPLITQPTTNSTNRSRRLHSSMSHTRLLSRITLLSQLLHPTRHTRTTTTTTHPTTTRNSHQRQQLLPLGPARVVQHGLLLVLLLPHTLHPLLHLGRLPPYYLLLLHPASN